MNYEELLAAKNEGKKNPRWQPIGGYYREQVDGKWRGVVDIHPALISNIAFSKALKAECDKNKTLSNNRQIHFTPREEHGEVVRLELETGNFMTFEQVLIDNPAIVAEKGFIEQVLASLVDITTYLHEHGIRHLCYSPKTVFLRKGDNSVLLLSHGEFYLGLRDQKAFYGDQADFVAPEALEGGTVDERSDVYGIGKFMLALFDQSDLPLEYRSAVKKAVKEDPAKRFATPQDMLKAITSRRNTIKSAVSFAVAVAIGLLGLALYFDMFPETSPVEFVKPAPASQTDNSLLDGGFDPEELGESEAVDDSTTVNEQAAMRDYEAKAEEIFRKRYEKEANRILSKIYNKDYMNNSEKRFLSESESTIEELMKAQSDMGSEAGLTPERAQLIATEIIERVTNQKKKEIGATNNLGVQK